MAEESDLKRSSSMDNPKAKTFDNGWIVCHSQKRPGLLYDFNTLTGEAVWRDPDKIAHNTAIIDKNKIPFDCHEPTEPPNLKVKNQKKVSPKSSFMRTPNSNNKQIINNQFPDKAIAIAPFGNSACGPFGLIDPSNTMNTVNSAPIWVAAPTTPQVLLPTVTSLNQVQAIYGNLENVQLQNSSLSLSNRFQVLNQLNAGSPIGVNLGEEGSCHHQGYNYLQQHNNYRNWHQRPNRRPVNSNLNRHTDLRSKLSSRRRQDLNTGYDAKDKPETYKKDASAIVPEDLREEDLNPDDNDKWLEAHTDGEGRELNMDMECFWDLADRSASRDCCYIIPTTRVLLNNMRFLASLVISDDRLRLLTPRDVVRTLRTAAFSSNGPLADYASRARTFAIRQMKKFADNLKDAPNIQACLALVDPDIHVVRLVDGNDILNQESITDGTITIAELKRLLTRSANPKPKPQNVSKMQKICENIKIIVPNDEVKPESSPQVVKPRVAQVSLQESPSKSNTNSLDTDKTKQKEIEIQTDLSPPPLKRTANACVQTDFDFTLAPSTEIDPNKNKSTEAVNGADDISDKQTLSKFPSSDIRPKEIAISSAVDTAKYSNEAIATTAAPRKIRLKRLQHSSTSSNADEKKPFKWRRKKTTQLTAASEERSQKTISTIIPSSTNLNVIEQNDIDNSMDCKFSDVSASAKMVDGSSTSGVLSNSVDSIEFFKINTQAIRNESKTDQIVVYEVTNDFMTERLRLRCDEWMSRFVQIMEEVLSQVLLLDPPFIDATLPPPWTFYEATVCVKRKFISERTIVDASDKLAVFLLKINDDRGNIETRISPTDFMQMYTYGVNLVNKLQSVLKNCEDVNIACVNLSRLLSDIREPNLDESYDEETFNCDDPISNSPNISELVTDMSTTISGVPEVSKPVNSVSPKNKEKRSSCNNSPARYSLRSSFSSSIQKKNVYKEAQSDTECSENKEYTLFSSLGLQKRDIMVDCHIARTIINSPKAQITSPFKEATVKSPENSEALKPNDSPTAEPKIIRNFNVCPEFETRLKESSYTEVDHAEVENDYVTDNYTDDDGAKVHYVTESNLVENGGISENNDFAEGDFTDYEPYDYDNDCSGVLRPRNMDADPICEKTPSGVIDANRRLKQVVRKITYKYRRCLTDLGKFCEVTNATINDTGLFRQERLENVTEKITKVGEHATNVCRRLKNILNRDPVVTSNKFRDILESYGIMNFDMSDAQMAEYRGMIENYLELAERLLTCVARLAEAVKVK